MKKALLVGAAIAAMLAAPAMAADLPAKAPVYNAPVAAPYNWTGLYIGANAGYGWGNQAIGVIGDPLIVQPGFLTPNGISSVSGNPKGFVGGGQIGYNWQSGQMVYGVEADFDAAHIASSQDIHFIAGIPRTVHGDQNLNWLGTLRGRLGFTPVDRLLVYATGGLAVGHANVTADFSTDPPLGCVAGTCATGSATSKTNAGWTVGAGLEYALMGNWSVRGEYFYYDVGTVNTVGADPRFAPPATINGSLRLSGSVARLGVNYLFH